VRLRLGGPRQGLAYYKGREEGGACSLQSQGWRTGGKGEIGGKPNELCAKETSPIHTEKENGGKWGRSWGLVMCAVLAPFLQGDKEESFLSTPYYKLRTDLTEVNQGGGGSRRGRRKKKNKKSEEIAGRQKTSVTHPALAQQLVTIGGKDAKSGARRRQLLGPPY